MSVKVAVLMGGPSSERDVSLKTGRAMVDACIANGFETVSVEFENNILSHLDTFHNVDVVMLALHGGIGENGRIQGMFESLGIRYTGSNALSSAMCMDKHISKLLAEDMGIATPKWQRHRKGKQLMNSNGYPCIVKPNSEGSTVGLTIVNSESEMENALSLAFSYDDEILKLFDAFPILAFVTLLSLSSHKILLPESAAIWPGPVSLAIIKVDIFAIE